MIDTTEAVRLAAEALWVTEHYPVDENDMRLPSADHPDCVGMEVMSYPSAAAAVTAALPALAEQFAALIEAARHPHGYHRAGVPPEDAAEWCALCDRMTHAARLVREAAEVTG